VRTLSNRFKAQAVWLPDNGITLAKLEPKLLPLISSKGSLTNALVSLSNNNFNVKVVSQRVAVPKFHEQIILGYPLSRAAMIREVELQLFGISVVFARSIIPLRLVEKKLITLGSTPLGQVLFSEGKIRISKRQYAQTSLGLSTVNARRTPYDYQGAQILVSEFFLPEIYQYLS